MKPTVTIVIPVYNEEADLPNCIATLSEFITENQAYAWDILIADNASIDNTRQVSESLCREYASVDYFYVPQKGRGRALRLAWLRSTSDILCYMDVDLSTDLLHLPEIIDSVSGEYDIAVGSRLSKESQVKRSVRREIISQSYNLIIKTLFFTQFPDAQCGFKAITNKAAHQIVPLIKNNYWFFDTELLLIAAKRGFRIRSIPVKWDEDPSSSVRVMSTAWEDIKGLLRLRIGGIPRIEN